jgi:hypothetical protein
MKKSEIAKTKVNISIIVSQDVDDFVSDNNDIGGEVCSTLKCANEVNFKPFIFISCNISNDSNRLHVNS